VSSLVVVRLLRTTVKEDDSAELAEVSITDENEAVPSSVTSVNVEELSDVSPAASDDEGPPVAPSVTDEEDTEPSDGSVASGEERELVASSAINVEDKGSSEDSDENTDDMVLVASSRTGEDSEVLVDVSKPDNAVLVGTSWMDAESELLVDVPNSAVNGSEVATSSSVEVKDSVGVVSKEVFSRADDNENEEVAELSDSREDWVTASELLGLALNVVEDSVSEAFSDARVVDSAAALWLVA
jgi:hypothetical protein